MQKYDEISEASVAAFEAALSNSRRSDNKPLQSDQPVNAADAFAAALQGNNLHPVSSQQNNQDKHYEREYCRNGEWQRGWKSALSRDNPPTCRATWEADMRETLLQDSLTQTSPL